MVTKCTRRIQGDHEHLCGLDLLYVGRFLPRGEEQPRSAFLCPHGHLNLDDEAPKKEPPREPTAAELRKPGSSARPMGWHQGKYGPLP